jgi:hypothetical protein
MLHPYKINFLGMSFWNVFIAILCLGFFVIMKHSKKFVMYVEGTLYPSISFLEIGRDIMPIPKGWEETYAYL